jgi:hypothetical protein
MRMEKFKIFVRKIGFAISAATHREIDRSPQGI